LLRVPLAPAAVRADAFVRPASQFAQELRRDKASLPMISQSFHGAAGRIVAAVAVMALAACASNSPNQDGIRNTDAASRVRVAMAAEAAGQPDVAVSMFAAAASAAPDEPEVQARYAAALSRNGQAQEAERRPRDPRMLLAMGQMRARAGVAAEAIAAFEQVLAQAPRDVAALNGRGVALDLLGRHGEAQQSYRAAQVVEPSHIASANNLAFSLMLSGQAAEAVTILSSLHRRPGAPPRVATNLGIAQAALGDTRGAQATLEGRVDEADLGRIVTALGGAPDRSAPAALQRVAEPR
jgi:Flp pilus assembly protein TadD